MKISSNLALPITLEQYGIGIFAFIARRNMVE